MRGQFALKTEIIQSAHKTVSKERSPVTVDDHPGRERILWRHKPFGER